MDELELLKAHADAQPPPSRETVFRARSRLLASMRRPRPRPLRFALPALGAGAAAVIAITVGISSSGVPGGDGPGTGSTEPVSAVTVLERAAKAAAAEPHREPRGDQYAFVETRDVSRPTMGDEKGKLHRTLHRTWIPVDGSTPAVYEYLPVGGSTPGARMEKRPDWERGKLVNDDVPEPPMRNSYQALDRLPRDPDKLLAQLRQRVERSSVHPADDQVFDMIGELVRESVVPPDVRATLFRAAAKIPGVAINRDAVDAAGRRGIAVTHVDVHGQVRDELIFDRGSYELLGTRSVVAERPRTGATPDPTSTVPPMEEAPGTVLYSSAVLRTAIVDDRWQLP